MEGRERGKEGCREGETKGGNGGGYYKGREGVVGVRTEWEREGRERGTEEGM